MVTRRTYIMNMSTGWGHIREKMVDQWDECFEHLMKVYFWRDTQYQSDWERHIFSKYPRTYRVMKNNQLPSYEALLEVLWGVSGDMIPQLVCTFIKNMNSDHPSNKYRSMPTIDYAPTEEIQDYLYEYFSWLSKILSERGAVDISEVRQELCRLLAKYPYYI